jgi:NAD(P)-dependent dehydrogenase (short-subunit alcohol dehydrogenase family)
VRWTPIFGPLDKLRKCRSDHREPDQTHEHQNEAEAAQRHVRAGHFQDLSRRQALDDKQKAAMLAAVPLGRLGKPSDIASAVAFLASPGAAYITGTTLHVNGGMFMG